MESNIYCLNESGVTMKFDGHVVTFSGYIDCLEPGKFMTPFLENVHDFILEKKLKSIITDITELNFFNSSGIKEFVDWILKLERLPDDQKYILKFLYSKDILWQEQSMFALTFLNIDLVKIEMK